MRISIAASDIARLKKAIEDTGRSLRKELVIATNYTAGESKKIIAKQIYQEINATQANIKKVIEITRRAKEGDISATVEVNKDKRLNLSAFAARQTKKGVSYKVSRGTKGKTKVGNAFIVPKYGGRVYVRQGTTRRPIRQLRGPSFWGVFVVGKKQGPSVKETEAELKKQIDRRIRFIELKASGAI